MGTTAAPGFTTSNRRALQAIERTGGITAAAADLGISSTSIDKHLARLRTVFADDLIVFTGRDTLVTPLGTQVLGLVDTLFEVHAEIASLTPSPLAVGRAGSRSPDASVRVG
ncbi:LysR family transcriptional regulator [Promicromonospora kroppenstedtii]|uniref:LysR family transcriptional regulator n=1 Tax=Promicromonospora kroppenstedtii TaxID=440482 RepID=A0ABW7XS88_9MICO